MESVESNEKATYKLGGITGKGFMPGQSGNPGGRKRNPLKDFSLAEFNSWTDEQKAEFLSKISPLDRWKMTEGNPEQSIDGSIDLKVGKLEEIQAGLKDIFNGQDKTGL